MEDGKAPGRRKAAITTVAFSYGGIAFAVAKNILLVPLYLSHFSLNAYGAWVASGGVLGMMTAFDAGMSTVFLQRFGEAFGAADRKRISNLSGAALFVFTPLYLLVLICGLALGPAVVQFVRTDPGDREWITLAFRLGALGVASGLAQESLLSIAFSAQRAIAGGVIRLVAQLAEIVVIAGGLFLGFGIPSLGAGMAVGGVTGVTLASCYVIWLWRRLRLCRPTYDRDTISEMLQLAPLTFAGRMASAILGRAEPTIVSGLIGPGASAILTLTGRAYQIGQSLINPIAGALMPGLAHYVGEHGREKARPLLVDIFQLWALLAAMLMPLVFALNSTFIALWVGPDKYAGHLVSALLLASTLIVARVNLLGIVVVGAFGRIAEATWNGLRELAVRFTLMIGLLLAIGIPGPPLATFLSLTLMSGVYLSRLIAQDVDPRGNAGWTIQTRGIGLLTACIAIGVAGLILIPRITHWLGFCVAGVVLAIALVSVALIWGRVTGHSPIAVLRSVRGSRPGSVPTNGNV